MSKHIFILIALLTLFSHQFFKLPLTNLFLTPRMLLLESLQSKLLRCKLLEHLLDYACPVKISLPMSLSLLLHFLKHCTVAPDPTVNITFLILIFIFMSLNMLLGEGFPLLCIFTLCRF